MQSDPESLRRRVGIVEDSNVYVELLREILEEGGFEIAFVATTMQAALNEIAALETGISTLDAVTLDGNLGDYNRGADGRKLVALFSEKLPNVVLIGMSGDSMSGVTADVGKGNILDLVDTIKRVLPEN